MRRHVAAVVVLLTACGGGPARTSGPTELATPSPPATESQAILASIDLADIVISADSPPAGMSVSATRQGKGALTRVVVSRRAAEFFALPGFVTGQYAQFSGESGVLLSLGLVFDTAENAEVALDLYLDELQSEEGYGFGAGVEAGLGDEGTCDEDENPALGGLRESICVWRNGRLVLIIGGTLDPGHLRSLAEGMNAAAP